MKGRAQSPSEEDEYSDAEDGTIDQLHTNEISKSATSKVSPVRTSASDTPLVLFNNYSCLTALIVLAGGRRMKLSRIYILEFVSVLFSCWSQVSNVTNVGS